MRVITTKTDGLGDLGVSALCPLRGRRLALEVSLPAYQWLDGPQLETDWTLTLGWQRAF